MGILSALCVLINSQFPRRLECTRQYILARHQANMRMSHLSQPHRNRQEFERRHPDFPTPLVARRARQISWLLQKNRRSSVGVLFHRLQAQCNSPRVYCGHRVTLRIIEYLTIISRHRSTVPGQTMSKPSVRALRKRPGCSGQPASYHFIEIVIAFASSEADAVSSPARFECPLKQRMDQHLGELHFGYSHRASD